MHEHHRQKYWHYFLRMDNHPKGWLHSYETPLEMICLYGRVFGYNRTHLISKLIPFSLEIMSAKSLQYPS